jgi:hypothetical protein
MKLLLVILGAFFLFHSTSVFGQVKDSSTLAKDTICDCKASLPLEFVATSLTWGIANTWIWRGAFVHYPKGGEFVNFQVILSPEALFLLMFSLCPVSEWTSGCEASWWNSIWIGFLSMTGSIFIYGGIYGYDQPGDANNVKYTLKDYLILGALPSIGSCLVYNLFLHPPEKKDHSMYLIPSFGKNMASLNFMMQF